MRGVFLDLSKAFDKVWHDGLSYKPRCMGIYGEYLGLIDSFLSDRFQRVLLNGQISKWSQIKAGVPQGSVLGPLLFLVYIDDLSEELTSNIKLFADDTSIISVVRDSSSFNENLPKMSLWGTNGRCCLIPMFQNKPKRLFFHVEKIFLTVVTSIQHAVKQKKYSKSF